MRARICEQEVRDDRTTLTLTLSQREREQDAQHWNEEYTLMKTTLIYAGIVGHGFGSVGKGLDSGWVSHGLCSLSACAKQAGFPVDLIDLRCLRDWEHLREEVAARRGLPLEDVAPAGLLRARAGQGS